MSQSLIKHFTKPLLGLALLASSSVVLANQDPLPLGTDSRLRVVAYNQNDVVTIVGSQLTQTSIQFGDSETIKAVEAGNSIAWTVEVDKNKQNILFLKPTMDMPNTNLEVVTDKYIYHFALVSAPKNSPNNKEVTYNVRFKYPDEINATIAAQTQVKKERRDAVVTNNPVDPLKVNWDYSFSEKCSKEYAPIKAFDDGKFTYFQFPNNTETPAIFMVDSKGHESLANWTMRGKYVVIQRIARQFSMRNGKVVSCVFNQAYKA
jgi:type IV secretion system protein VirB9